MLVTGKFVGKNCVVQTCLISQDLSHLESAVSSEARFAVQFLPDSFPFKKSRPSSLDDEIANLLLQMQVIND